MATGRDETQSADGQRPVQAASERARQIVSAAERDGRGFDDETSLEVLYRSGTYRLACLVQRKGGETAPQIVAFLDSRADAAALADIVFTEAADRVNEIKDMAADGRIPGDVPEFSALHDLFDANMIGCAGSPDWFEDRPLIGLGAPDRSEAECAVMNCANNAVDRMLRRGALAAVAQRPGTPGL